MKQDTQIRKMTRRVPLGHVAVALFVAGGLAACGTTSSTATSTTAPGSATTSGATNAGSGGGQSITVSTAQNSKFGTILVSGNTLYTLAPSSTPCGAACLKIWPELVLPSGMTMATAGSGVSASSLGTANRGGGVNQVTYQGKALYYFSEDTAAGQAKGNVTDKWGKWTVVSTSGSASPSTGNTSPSTTAPASGGAGF